MSQGQETRNQHTLNLGRSLLLQSPGHLCMRRLNQIAPWAFSTLASWADLGVSPGTGGELTSNRKLQVSGILSPSADCTQDFPGTEHCLMT